MNQEFVTKLIQQFDKSSIFSMDFAADGISLSLKKGPVSEEPHIRENKAPTKASVAEPVEKQAAATTEKADFIKSPIVGTFYKSPSPDTPAYVQEGSTVKAGQPLCILEAMKMMNTLEAEYDCKIEKVFAANGDLVEFNQPLFQVSRI